ncbi:hypothetical protein [Hydrogenophaga aquatica]
MSEFNTINEKDIFFVVCAPPFNRNSGGIYALHALAEDITMLGCNAGILTTETRPGSHARVIDLEFYNKIVNSGMMVVSIYPEIIHKNTLEADYSVWWLLNYPGFINKTWDGNSTWADRVCCFTEELGKDIQYNSILTYPLYDPDFFHPNRNVEKTEIIYYANRITNTKGYTPPDIPATKILTPASRLNYKELRSLFWRTKIFLTSEWTGTAIIAQLCGVPVIFLESPILHPGLHSGPHFDYGSAWGFTEESVQSATESLPEVTRTHLQRKSNWTNELKSEVNIWIQEVKNKP